MHMVTKMLQFTRALRTGDWGLHLQALHSFTKYFFAHDRLNYSRMIPLYLAEIEELPRTDAEIYSEFLSGNWVVNKNQVVPFCAIGADHGFEQVNRSMKVTGGLVGITLNQAARTKFFLIAPEMANLANQAKNMAGVASKSHTRHHSDTLAVLPREDKNVQMLTETIEKFCNPFTEEGQDLFNIATKVVMPDSIKEDICDQPVIGQRLLVTFVTERIKTGKINIWSTIKKRKLGTWKTNAKKITISTKGKLVELREDRSLFARLLVVCRTRPEIDLKETIGIYEFSVVPRSLFAADGTMLRCSRKSALMPILEKLPSAASNGEGINSTPVPTGSQMKVIIIDGMAELQCLDKPEWIHNCVQLAQHFIDTLEQKYGRINEKRVIFDRYDLTISLKQATREKRQGGKDPVYYKITDSTKISKLPMKRLLSHSKTKMELTAFLAEKAISHFSEQHGSRLICCSKGE